ncbi:MAG TPA: hypothetical protein ACQGQX_06400, partial [Xylella taiwanensis]
QMVCASDSVLLCENGVNVMSESPDAASGRADPVVFGGAGATMFIPLGLMHGQSAVGSDP